MSPSVSATGALPTALTPLARGLADPTATARVVAQRPAQGGRAAAVLVLIEIAGTGPEIVFVERAATLRNHPGQMAFPGGGVDDTDPSYEAAALREGEEEIGLDVAGVSIMGRLPGAHVAVSGFDVVAVVGWWHTPVPVSSADPGEVARVIRVPVARLVDPRQRVTVRIGSGYRGPAFLVDDPDAPDEPIMIWGLTAHILDGVLEMAGWGRAWDSDRYADIPARYRTDHAGRGRADDH
ncbi:MAG: CoA pyrophosphatase [Propionibacteriales bacterium]|nr:CoA pyrophosphatase [Propionibacteriales bacterium]